MENYWALYLGWNMSRLNIFYKMILSVPGHVSDTCTSEHSLVHFFYTCRTRVLHVYLQTFAGTRVGHVLVPHNFADSCPTHVLVLIMGAGGFCSAFVSYWICDTIWNNLQQKQYKIDYHLSINGTYIYLVTN